MLTHFSRNLLFCSFENLMVKYRFCETTKSKTILTHFFHKFTFCSFEKLMVEYTFCETIKIHDFVKQCFIHNSKIV